jgi:large subunit ribosomal protein L15
MSMQQNTIKSNQPRKNRKRVGRGDASGNGSYSGRGMKGQKSRSGGGVRPGFEGGQLPMIKRLPSLRGFTNVFKKQFNAVNLDRIMEKFPEGGDIETKDLVGARVIRDNGHPTKILGRGEVTVALSITANKFTKSAKEKIEAAGGSVKVLD